MEEETVSDCSHATYHINTVDGGRDSLRNIDYIAILIRLIAREDLVSLSRRETSKSYKR
jgi:hypothetical protein